jgi:hypothetical protein
LEREGLLVCISGYSPKSSKNIDFLLVGKGHLKDKPAGELKSPGSMSFGDSFVLSGCGRRENRQLPLAWQSLVGTLCRRGPPAVNALDVTDVSFSSHQSNG